MFPEYKHTDKEGKSGPTYFFFPAVRALLSHDTDPLIPQHAHREDCNATAVDELHRLHGQHGGDDVVHVVLAARHRHQPIAAAAHEHQAWTTRENQVPYIIIVSCSLDEKLIIILTVPGNQ